MAERQAWSQRTIRGAVSKFPGCLSSRLPHSDGSVDHAALEDDNGLRVDVALHTGSPLYLDTLFRDDRSDYGSANYDFVGADVAVNGPLAAKQKLARAAHGALDNPLDLHHTGALDIAHDFHP